MHLGLNLSAQDTHINICLLTFLLMVVRGTAEVSAARRRGAAARGPLVLGGELSPVPGRLWLLCAALGGLVLGLLLGRC